MQKAYFNWSSGKDSALALYRILAEREFEVTKLVTTINTDVDRVSMHGLRETLLDRQAEALGFPLEKILLHGAISMTEYSEVLGAAAQKAVDEGSTHSIFGDIFLEDLKAYRDEQLAKVGLKGVYPLWKKDTKQLITEFIELGFKAITVCVNGKHLDKSFAGRIIDHQFIADLPPAVDPCGENGEFHTFVFDGPIFSKPILFEVGEIVKRSYKPKGDQEDNCFSDDEKPWDTEFYFCDLIPV